MQHHESFSTLDEPSAIAGVTRHWTVHEIVDVVFRSVSVASAGLILLITGGIFLSLMRGSWLSISHFGAKFFWSTSWNPMEQEFGALSSLYGTVMTTVIALLFAIPLSLIIALFLTELASPMFRQLLGTAIEFLSGVPSILFGIWGLLVFAPYMADYIQPFFAKIPGFSFIFTGPFLGIGIFTAGLLLTCMILPMMTAVMCNVFLMIPETTKEAGFGIGATRWEVARDITLRYGKPGIIGAALLGLGRAMGETMAVAFVIGNRSAIASSLFAPGNTLASRLANEFAEASTPLYLSALLELGFILFTLTFCLQLITPFWLHNMRQKLGGHFA